MKIALAFSGGLDTCWCIPHLRGQGHEIVTVTVDVGGFSAQDKAEVEQRSQALGATAHHWVPAEAMFFDEVIKFLVFGNVLRGATYPLCVGAERALQAREVARAAASLGADAAAHGCTAAGNDQIRFEVAFRTLAPGLPVIAPVRDESPSRADQLQLLTESGLDFPRHKAEYSINSGLWGVTIGGIETTGTSQSIPDHAWQRTVSTGDRAATSHTLSFYQGTPSALDGKAMDPVTLIHELDQLAGSYGIGRGIHLGETILGIKGRVAFEAPAAAVIMPAHRELEKLTLTKRQLALKDMVATSYGEWIHEGLFTEPAARQAEALMLSSQERVSGDVHFELQPRSMFITGVTSPHSLHSASRAVYGESVGEWEPADARGFGRIYGLAGILHARAGGDK